MPTTMTITLDSELHEALRRKSRQLHLASARARQTAFASRVHELVSDDYRLQNHFLALQPRLEVRPRR